ncbi:MAG: hypothetical protein RLZZ303_2176 [Candidatus Hydrogenedentota bacterium]
MSKPIFSRLDVEPAIGANPVQAVVPIHEHVQFIRLVDEAARGIAGQDCRDLRCLVDSHTAANCAQVRELLGQVSDMRIVGDYPPSWSKADGVLCLPRGAQLGVKDHFFVVMAPDLHLAILGTADVETAGRAGAFSGGWTIHPDCAVSAARLVLAGDADEIICSLSDGQGVSGTMANTSISLMALQSGDLAMQREDHALDKADLFSVLNILKAISARRRAHDVLYVFVEQIARVVASDRCSVVRVWGQSHDATVLASHEDASVTDYRISLTKYPELLEAMNRRETIVIQDTRQHPLMQGCRQDLEQAGVRAVLVIPIVLFDDEVGSLLLRAARKDGSFTLREMSFFEIVSEAASNALERAHLLENIQQANERLEHIARTDGLTGLYNRRYFHEQFNHEFERARRYDTPLACMIFDVDNFKSINDNHGHLVGDSVLVEISNRLLRRVRSIDLSARYGGEEFVVLMPQTEPAGALAQAERVLKHIAEQPFEGLPADLQVTVSIGVANYNPATMRGPSDLLRAADQGLYEAKQNGKNRVVVTEDYQP